MFSWTSRVFLAGGACFAMLVWMTWQSSAQPPVKREIAQGALTIQIQGLRSKKGIVSLTLFNSEKGYPMRPEHAFARVHQKLKARNATFVFPSIPFGRYAAAAFHDENGNGKLDTNWIGIPNEGTAASNDAKGFMGPPKYRDASFPLQQKKLTISMKMNY